MKIYANFSSQSKGVRTIHGCVLYSNKYGNCSKLQFLWLEHDVLDEFLMVNYDGYAVSRDKRGGGVAIYVKKCLKHRIIEKNCCSVKDVFDCISIEVSVSDKKR